MGRPLYTIKLKYKNHQYRTIAKTSSKQLIYTLLFRNLLVKNRPRSVKIENNK